MGLEITSNHSEIIVNNVINRKYQDYVYENGKCSTTWQNIKHDLSREDEMKKQGIVISWDGDIYADIYA